MSHTLHRLGKPEDLKKDWVVLAMSAKGINKRESASKLRKFLKLALSHHPVNFGDMRSASSFVQSSQDVLKCIHDDSIIHAVFSKKKSVSAFLRDLKKKELGISVVISGLFEEGKRCVKDAGLRPHTASFSLGIWGNRERLPERPILEMSTMCGHGLISPSLIRLKAEEVASRQLTIDEAVAHLAKPCVCGIFNPVRASELLSAMAKK